MGRRWIVIDPGFEHKDSHHMIVNNQITSACESDEVIIVAGKNLDAAPLNLNAQIVPFFDINLYPVNYHNLPMSEYIVIRDSFVRKLMELFEKLKLSENDCLIVHTAFSYLYEALARAMLKLDYRDYSIFISTMFSPGRIVEFGEVSTSNIREYSRHKFAFSLFERLKDEKSIEFFIDSPTQMYVDAYQMIWPSGSVKLHPSVCGGGVKVSHHSTNRVLAYLGGPKWDKGIEFTVNALCNIGNRCSDTEFIFHFNDEFPGADAYEPLITKLENCTAPKIRVLRGNLDKPQYEELLESCSTYVMLYDPKDYANKTSGVLWDVLRHAQGKKVVVSKGSWHEKELTLIGATFASVEFGNSEDLVNTITSNAFQPLSAKLYQSAYVKTLLGNFGEHIKARVSTQEDSTNSKIEKTTKKILVVRTNYGHFTKLSGPGNFVDYLPEHGYDVKDVLVPLGHENAHFDNDGKRWEVLDSFNKILKSYQVNSFDIECEILRDYEQYDVIHFVDGEHSGLLVALAKLNGLIKNGPKLVATFHQPDYVMKDLVPEPSFLEAFDTIHLMSPCQKQAFLDLGVTDDKLIVVPHGVSEEHYKPSISFNLAGPAKSEIESVQQKLQGKKVCLTVGNWLRDYDTFLHVAREFRSREDVYFVAVSRGLELTLDAEDTNILIFNEGVEDRTLHWLYRRANLMFLPLHGGAANNAILEAFAAGTCIVTSNLLSTRYYTNDSATYCDNSRGFVSAIKNTLGVESQHTYENEFLSWCNVASKMNGLLYS